MRSVTTLVLASACSFVLGSRDPTPLPHGISVDVNGSPVTLEAFGQSAFRLGVGRDGHDSSLFVVDPKSYADFKQIQNGSYVGISTAFGSLQIDPQSAAFQMLDSNGEILTQSSNLFPSETRVGSSTCDNPK